MGWTFKYRIKLSRPLEPSEAAELKRVCERHGLRLAPTWDGVDRRDDWKGLVPDEDLERLRKLGSESFRPTRAEADYADTLQVSSNKRLASFVRWLRDVEKIVPAAEFVISDDYSLSSGVRPSEAELEDDSDEADPIEATLEQARRDFARWKKSQK